MKQLLCHSTRPPLIVATPSAGQKPSDSAHSPMPTLFVSSSVVFAAIAMALC